jgi:hypothetical protein
MNEYERSLKLKLEKDRNNDHFGPAPELYPQKDNYIKIWNFDNAPEEYKLLSPHGGDEEYVAFVPDGFEPYFIDYDDTKDEKDNYPYIGFLDSGTMFGCCDVSHTKVEGGWIFIGAH